MTLKDTRCIQCCDWFAELPDDGICPVCKIHNDTLCVRCKVHRKKEGDLCERCASYKELAGGIIFGKHIQFDEDEKAKCIGKTIKSVHRLDGGVLFKFTDGTMATVQTWDDDPYVGCDLYESEEKK